MYICVYFNHLNMKKILFIFLTFIFLYPVMAQQSRGKSLGDYVNINKKGQDFIFHTTQGTARVTIFSPTLFKISVWENREHNLPSYAVVASPQKVKFTYRENKNNFLIITDSLTLQISKFPLRFTFLTSAGKIINQDDKLGTFWLDNKIFTFKHLFPQEIFTGLGEKTGSLNRRGSAYTNWNTDNPHYQNWSDPLYSTIPFYMGRHDGLQYGIFVDNTTKSVFNFGAGNNRLSYFCAEDDQIDYYFFYHHTPAGILKEYSSLTGRINMPPLWGLGFQQCRWSYTPDKEVMEIATAFRDKQIPLDVIYLDIAYMDDYKVFTWNPKAFPTPRKLIGDLKAMGLHTMVIIDPGIKVEKGYRVYDDGVKQNCFIKYPDGSNYSGQVWPGWCNFPDFTNPKVRLWWGKQFQSLVDMGVTGFWNDMNEIAVWGKNVPPVIQMDWEGIGVSYLKGKNVFGMQMARATFEGTKMLMKNRRPLVLTRAGYAGLQRYTAIWTGDNQATDEHMFLGIRLINSFGLSGVPFAGYDVGGFGGDATPALYARWVSLGAFSPFFRAHSSINTRRSEPWSYGDFTQELAKHYIELRYHLLPYIYAAFYQASQTGMPVQRSLSISYASDKKIFDSRFENQYMFGQSLLIIPAKSTQKIVNAYLPKGKWYLFYNDKQFEGSTNILIPCPLNKLPVFVKAGAIIPVQKLIQYTGENPGDTLEIHVYQGKNGSRFVYYEDDGNTYNYQKGDFYIRDILYDNKNKKIVMEKPSGKYVSEFKMFRFILHGFNDKIKAIRVNGKSIDFQTNPKHLFLKEYQKPKASILTISLPNRSEKITINW